MFWSWISLQQNLSLRPPWKYDQPAIKNDFFQNGIFPSLSSLIRNPQIWATSYSGITTTVFSTKWILPVDFKPSKRLLNQYNFFMTNKFSRVRKHEL